MTKRYTAADFANAKFAEHPETDALAVQRNTGLCEWTTFDDDGYTGWLTTATMLKVGGWVPVPTKPTITRSEVRNQIKTQGDEWANGYYTALTDFGGGVIEDPEPTNTDRLKTVLREAWDGHQSMNDVAEWLDKNGVTAPKEDN